MSDAKSYSKAEIAIVRNMVDGDPCGTQLIEIPRLLATIDAIARERDEARASALEEAAGWLRDHRPNYMDYKSREGDESATWWGFNWEQPTSDAVDAALDRCAQAIDALATRRGDNAANQGGG